MSTMLSKFASVDVVVDVAPAVAVVAVAAAVLAVISDSVADVGAVEKVVEEAYFNGKTFSCKKTAALEPATTGNRSWPVVACFSAAAASDLPCSRRASASDRRCGSNLGMYSSTPTE